MKAYKAANDIPISYVKYAISCENALLEMERKLKLIWETQKTPIDWSHSKLVALWKCTEKGKATDP